MALVKQRAFTLIELMIAVSIVGILAAIAYPSYQDQAMKTRRSDAKEALIELRQFMERVYTRTNRYDENPAGVALTLPFNEAPKSGASKYYDIAFSALAAQRYTLVATPKNQQSNDAKCATISIDEAGIKTFTGSGLISDCW